MLVDKYLKECNNFELSVVFQCSYDLIYAKGRWFLNCFSIDLVYHVFITIFFSCTITWVKAKVTRNKRL